MAEKPSLAAKSGTLTAAPAFQMPAVFQEPTEAVVSKFSTPYITFAHPNRKDEWAKLVGEFGSINEGEMFLVEGGKVTKLPVAKVNVVKIKQYWVEKNPAGDIVKASFTEKPRPWAEHMDAVVLLHVSDRITVANVNPHTTKCSGFVALANALIAAATPEWADKSPAHKETLQISQPFLRFFGELTIASPRISKGSGLPYRTTSCVIKPTTNTEVVPIKAFIENPESSKALQDAAEFFTFRIKELESKLLK